MVDERIFKDRSIVVYLSYAPAGFGHLRVADALYHGLPEYVTPILLGTEDKSVTFLHRILSVHPLLRTLFVWSQNGVREIFFTSFYRHYLHSTAKDLKDSLIHTINERIDPVRMIVIVATHFGIAHQVSVVKKEIEDKLGIKIILIVQVTDDSPQYIWYVHHANLIFVPSEKTAEVLRRYDRRKHQEKPEIVVTPYPISPYLGKNLKETEFEKREAQVNPKSESEINMMIPLSGAAVGTRELETFMEDLKKENSRFKFSVVVKNAPYTKVFLDFVKKHQNFIDLYTSGNDKEIVNLYEKVYMDEVIGLEVTKPSEQAFKSLYFPKQRGGSILLFAPPVGRQEFDNLDFLRRHQLIPSLTERAALWELSEQTLSEDDPMFKGLIEAGKKWRGIELPSNPKAWAKFISWCLESGLFTSMVKHAKPKQEPPHYQEEIGSTGVADFWNYTAKYVSKKYSELKTE
jgi:hypothetical protein